MPAGMVPMATPWGTFKYQNPMQVQMEMAGGINCVGNHPAKAPQISPEWVVEKSPDIFIKVPLSEAFNGMNSGESMKKSRDEIMEREELKRLAAIKNGKVFIIDPKLCAGPRQVVGICYYATWFHPGLFPDLNPESVHEEMLKQFWGIGLEGVWAYPGGRN
jgi:iron complex transport system substrate-binding protein